MVSLDQFKVGFLTECDELLADMEAMLVQLTPENADKDTLNAIFRCAHSIKGGSGAFGLDSIMNFTHILEALLDAMREDKVAVSTEAVDSLLQAVDVVNAMVTAAKENVAPPANLGAALAERLQSLASSGVEEVPVATAVKTAQATKATSGEKLFHIGFVAHETLLLSGNEPLLILRELCGLGTANIELNSSKLPHFQELNPTQCYLSWQIELTTTKSETDIKEVFEFVDDNCDLNIKLGNKVEGSGVSEAVNIELNSDLPLPSGEGRGEGLPSPIGRGVGGEGKAEDKQFARRASDANANTTIRVDLDKVDKLVNIVGELVITEAMIKAQMRNLPADQFASLMHRVEELSHHTRELQESVMSVRMQPVKSIFSRMPRIVRDLSAQLGKDIVLHTEGENTEVDKTVIEQLGDPLTHMIRNSVDHGIEKPELRLANGKSAQGNITLSAMHQGGRIVIEIRDDGAGINRAKVLAKAKEKGLFAPDAILSDEECDNIIFMAGFSTADVVSNVSGRGVGMDVVRRNIEGLEGTVRVTSEQGKGSLFRVSLPLTLAILDGMIVRVGSEFYVIPITSIIETMRPKKQDIRHVEGSSDVINVRGEFIPIIYLHEIFHIKDAQTDASNALVVLVEAGAEKLGIVVDELVGQQQVVIKSLEVNTDPVEGISGATILGDGKVSLILEINQLKHLACMHTAKSNNEHKLKISA
jgi:two-component system chemotaxis sensor kinase CheA